MRILHVSDLHFGRNDKPESIEALAQAGRGGAAGARDRERRPHAPRLRSPARARGRLPARARPAAPRDPGQPRHPVHVPEALHAARGSEFERLWDDDRAGLPLRRLVVVGLNSVRPWRHQSGRLRDEQVARAAELFDGRPTRRYRIVVAPPPPARRALALAQEAGREAEPRARRARRGRRRPDPRRAHPPEHDRRAARVRALDARRASTRSSSRSRPASASRARTGAARPAACTSTRSSPRALRVLTYIWREDGWGLTAVRTFPRGREPLAFESP